MYLVVSYHGNQLGDHLMCDKNVLLTKRIYYHLCQSRDQSNGGNNEAIINIVLIML